MKKVVITYKNADLDCVASAYAYSEYLQKTGENVSYFINGKVQDEVNIVCKLFGINLNNKLKEITDEKIIVVDTNTLSSISCVKPENIIEIIDHHPNSGDIKYCPNASLKLYEIGAVCTIIAEMFKDNNIEISKESAILLYYGIISNTINLKSKVRTTRDTNILNYLKEKCYDIKEDIIEKIFKEKSKFNIKDLRRYMEVEEKFILNEKEMIIGQLELVNASSFLEEHKNKINKIVKDVYSEYKVKYVFINIIDILNGYHILYANDEGTISYLEEKFKVKFNNGIFKENIIFLRKEIKKYLKNND